MRGILPAAVTPLDEAGKFLPSVLEQLLARLYGAGVHGVYLCGSTGEGMLQPREQRQAIVDTAMACTPRDRTVIVHVGAASLEVGRACRRGRSCFRRASSSSACRRWFR